MDKFRQKLKRLFPLNRRDTLVTLLILFLTSVLCSLLRIVSDTDFHVPVIFVLAVFFVSTLTSGYAYGILSSIFAVFGVNYIFTYPYFAFNFSMTGYPLTFICSFAVSIITCTMTTRLRQVERLRLEAEREKTRANLLRAISHDFRTPLTSIIGSINVVIEDNGLLTKSDVNSLLSDAKSDAEWLINMVENLLSITRIGEGTGYALHKEPQVVEEVVGEAVSKFKRQYPGFRLIINVPNELLLVPMDAVLIEQVIINLLMNSAIHGEGATYIMLTVYRDRDYAVFSVEDDGAGIAKDVLPHLLSGTPLRVSSDRVDDSSKNMGIGLTVCNSIVAAHGGKMTAENRPSGGAALSFTLPLGEDIDINADQLGDAIPETEDSHYGN